MEFKGRYLIPASPEMVWAALNDPEILRHCIPGCDRMEKTDPMHFSAAATLKIGPVKATFKAAIALSDLDPPKHCKLSGEGQGGVAGFARGEADVQLEPDAGGTVLSYTAQAAIGGKLAQIGQRLIDGAAKQIADDFFTRFSTAVGAGAQLAAATAEETRTTGPKQAEPAAAATDKKREGIAPEVWVVGLMAVIGILLLLFGAVAGP